MLNEKRNFILKKDFHFQLITFNFQLLRRCSHIFLRWNIKSAHQHISTLANQHINVQSHFFTQKHPSSNHQIIKPPNQEQSHLFTQEQKISTPAH